MADPKNELQASFQPAKRHQTYGDLILGLHAKGFRNHVDTKIEIESPVTAFCGVNGTGKSTLLQLAAAAYQAPNGKKRHYISSFILAGTLDSKPFADDASVEITYEQPPTSSGSIQPRTLTVSRSGSSWSGYDRQPERAVLYLGLGFHLPHAERDESFKKLFGDAQFRLREKQALEDKVVERVSTILLCKYDAAHQNTLRKRYGRTNTHLLTAKRGTGAEYSEANMGSGEARLYALVMRIEAAPEKSLFLIEEPETALHPSAQYELGRYLVEVAKRRGLQIFLTTHSEYLLLALPQKSRIYLKREGATVVPIPSVGVRQAVSLMDNFAIPAIYVLVEDDVAEAIVIELLRKHDPDFLKTARVIVAGDKDRIRQMMEVFQDQKLPVCAVRDGDFGDAKKLKMYKLFGTEPPEKEIFKSTKFKETFAAQHGVDWDAVDIANQGKDHHRWFDVLEQQLARKRAEILPLAACAYLEGITETDRQALVEQIKAAVP
ncbi:AAA family ATPase [Methylocaldum sp. RMAD-M]|uniref:ATP-dependent nuclease n=1 Tax=Methylocaldum sp. RMAD-M TaxID=2806557 RepID=UPI001AE4343D|nr:putative ATPase [Methylocaldum sp. RMAD-M]